MLLTQTIVSDGHRARACALTRTRPLQSGPGRLASFAGAEVGAAAEEVGTKPP
jgi:hypothetical protein